MVQREPLVRSGSKFAATRGKVVTGKQESKGRARAARITIFSSQQPGNEMTHKYK